MKRVSGIMKKRAGSVEVNDPAETRPVLHRGILLTRGLTTNVNRVSPFHGKITASPQGDYLAREGQREK